MRRRQWSVGIVVTAAAILAACDDDSGLVEAPIEPDVSQRPSAQVDTIPNQYIVVFADDVSDPVELTLELSAAHDLELRHTYQHTIKGFAAQLPPAALDELRNHPLVADVEPDTYMYVGGRAATPVVRRRAPPTPPSNVSVRLVSSTILTVRWSDNSSDEDEFWIGRKLGPSGTFILAGTAGADGTIFTDIGLDPDTEYCYIVAAVNADGYTLSEIVCATTPQAQPGLPAPPSDLVVTPVSGNQMDVSWTDNSADEGEFLIARRLGQSGAFSVVGQVGADETSFTDLSVSPNTEYCYVVAAVNPVGFAPSSIECATTGGVPQCFDTGNHDDLGQLWNIQRIEAHLNPSWQATQQAGCEITVEFYGIDTGVDSDHPDLNVIETVNFVASEPGHTGEDGNGHGTHTAGTAAAIDGNGQVVGVAPGAPVYGFRVCNDSGSCPISDIIAGVDEVTARKNAAPQKSMVANMSLGGGINGPLDMAIRRSVNAGIVYAVSAGNGLLGSCLIPADAQDTSPAGTGDDQINASNGSDGNGARINGIVTTTSSDQADEDANCNFGNPVTVAAPGVGVLSTWLNGATAVLSGTSMASPHAAGAAMLFLHTHPGATPTEVEQAMVDALDPWTTDDLPNAAGRLNVVIL